MVLNIASLCTVEKCYIVAVNLNPWVHAEKTQMISFWHREASFKSERVQLFQSADITEVIGNKTPFDGGCWLKNTKALTFFFFYSSVSRGRS